jgi:hypothetical protein
MPDPSRGFENPLPRTEVRGYTDGLARIECGLLEGMEVLRSSSDRLLPD